MKLGPLDCFTLLKIILREVCALCLRFVLNYGLTLRISLRLFSKIIQTMNTVYPKKYAHGFCFAVLCCGYTLTDFPISIRLTSLALWQSNDCPSASKATLPNMDKYFMWIHYERLHNHNKAKHNKTVCIFLGIYCTSRIWCNEMSPTPIHFAISGTYYKELTEFRYDSYVGGVICFIVLYMFSSHSHDRLLHINIHWISQRARHILLDYMPSLIYNAIT